MFKVVVNDGQVEMPDDDVYYVIAKEGIFLKKTIGVMDSVAPVNQISTLQSVAASARMRISKIPGPKFAKVIEFFRAVYHEYYAEAIVLLFYNEEKKTHTIIPPHQKVTGGACDYNRGITIEGLTMIGTIHSHGGMSAFHSTTDDKDEETFDGLHITLGNMRDEEISISASIVANGYRIMVDPNDYVEQLKLTQDVDEEVKKATTTVYSYIAGKLVKDEKKTSRYSYTQRKYDKRYVVTVTDHQKHFNKKWMNVVEKGTYSYAGYAGGYAVRGANRGWGGNYDSDVWGWANRQPWRRQNLPSTVVQGKHIPPQNVGPHKTPGIEFPPHDQDEDEDMNPCANCLFRDEKIDWAIKQYTEEVDGPDEDEQTNNFILDDNYDHMFEKGQASINIICGKCNLKFNLGISTNCPGCGEQAPDEIDMKKVDVAPIDPVIGHDFACPTCGNTFTHKGEDECPFCEEELDFADYRKVKAGTPSDEEIEVSSGGNLVANQSYKCKGCKTIFMTEGDIATCPKCGEYMVDGYNCSPFSTSIESEEIAEKDSGKLLAAATEEDSTLEKQPLPDPQKSQIPLSTKSPEDKHSTSLRKMFKRVFGSGGGK
jgi:rRNA maturation endonuclease Nob1